MKRVLFTTNKYVAVQDSKDFHLQNISWGEYTKHREEYNSRKRYWKYEDDTYRIIESRQRIEILFKKTGKTCEVYRSIDGLCCNGMILHSGTVSPSRAYITSKGCVKIQCSTSALAVLCYPTGYTYCVNAYTNKKWKDKVVEHFNDRIKRA